MGSCLSVVRHFYRRVRFHRNDYQIVRTHEEYEQPNRIPVIPEDPPSSEGGSSIRKISSEKRILELESELKAQKALTGKLTRSHHENVEHMRILNLDLDTTRDEKETQEARSTDLQRLLEKTRKSLENANFYASHFERKCQKLEAQLALLEQKVAQESLASGSSPDDHANLACWKLLARLVDKATEDMTRVLHNVSITKLFPLNSSELQKLVGQISPTHPEEFSRRALSMHVWSHWICVQVFQGFEHVFFDVDEGRRTSPLDTTEHALECFQSCQQKRSASSLDPEHDFQAFCLRKYRSVFPQWVVWVAFPPFGSVCDENGRFNGDEEIYDRFKKVARAVWLLHELAFSFDPPASILRMARGTPFEKEFHELVTHVDDDHETAQLQVMPMTRPAFRVRKRSPKSEVGCFCAATLEAHAHDANDCIGLVIL